MALPVNSTTPQVLAEHTQQRSGLSGVLLVLPPYYGSKALTAEDASRLLQLEHQLLQKPAAVPVFFVRETTDLASAVAATQDAFNRGRPPSPHSDRFQVRIQGSLPAKVPAKQALNYVASLRATDDQFKPGVPLAPTLLVTAHYDCFSPAPTAPSCADSAGSGAAAALLLLRVLHRTFTSSESRPNRNVLVVLTAGGPYGQEGLRQWLADADPAQVEAIDGAIVLDSIGGSVVLQQQELAALGSDQDDDGGSSTGQQQQLHVHAADGSSTTQQWLEAVQAAAQLSGVALNVVKDKSSSAAAAGGEAAAGTDAGSEAAAAGAAAFGHEHLARRGLAAVTISGLAAAPAPILSGHVRPSSVADVAAGVNLDQVLSAAQVAADAATRWLYPDLDPELRLLDLSVEADMHRNFLQGWIGLWAESHAMMPFDQADAAGTLLHDSLRQFLKAHSHSLKRHVWTTAGSPAALEAWSGTTAQLQVVKVAGFMLDMVLTASVIIYLLALFCGLVVATRGWSDLKAFMKPKPSGRRGSRVGSKRS